MRLALIAAVARNGVIGRDGEMPWRLSTDLKRFRRLTSGKPVIMGRKTFAAIGRPLPERMNIVITRDAGFAAPGLIAVDGPDAALDAAAGAEEAMVIGGGEVYRLFLPRADRLYITHVEAEPEGDAHFPAIDPAEWAVVSSEDIAAGERDSAATRYVVYERRRPA
ncbi:dihydrofolate reductase [Prosthecomicrobium pneumaticum]|uniref:Dihydrofolate reductase n=1 Tax=Prosthecomicrobium pneumaticum TaxID=81895 RepID=A0A7W9FR58_9HYPH|nr:dihydrofolate reductase [Prosthecomicrobium pneumaticum]MBB5755251.1 dihydrofolate reductase [Prosthecomicrobium pneumaticum]